MLAAPLMRPVKLTVMLLLAVWTLLNVQPARAQQPFTPNTPAASAAVTVRAVSEGRPVEQASVSSGRGSAATTNDEGEAELTLAAGDAEILVRKIGFAAATVRLVLRPGADTTVTVTLADCPSELGQVVVTATRTNKRLEDERTRVEVHGVRSRGASSTPACGSTSVGRKRRTDVNRAASTENADVRNASRGADQRDEPRRA